jgi:hypothetical protein
MVDADYLFAVFPKRQLERENVIFFDRLLQAIKGCNVLSLHLLFTSATASQGLEPHNRSQSGLGEFQSSVDRLPGPQ